MIKAVCPEIYIESEAEPEYQHFVNIWETEDKNKFQNPTRMLSHSDQITAQ